MPTNDERREVAAELRENRDPLTPYNLVDYIFDDPWNHDRASTILESWREDPMGGTDLGRFHAFEQMVGEIREVLG